MKRIFAFLLIFVLGMSMLSCGNGKTDNNKFEISDLRDAANNIVAGLGMTDMTELEENEIMLRYGILNLYSEACAIVSASISSEECVIFKTQTEEEAKQIAELLKTYRDGRIELYNGYAPDQTPRLESAFIASNGCYAVLAATTKPADAEKLWKALGEGAEK